MWRGSGLRFQEFKSSESLAESGATIAQIMIGFWDKGYNITSCHKSCSWPHSPVRFTLFEPVGCICWVLQPNKPNSKALGFGESAEVWSLIAKSKSSLPKAETNKQLGYCSGVRM